MAVSIGGGGDPIACGVAEAYYQTVPDYIIDNVFVRSPQELRRVIEEFSMKYRT
ncbi:MAG: hypothetical protein LBL45_02140 [Treponema sp.]|nr:hypothetical protein [Treponema sp.]